MVIGSSLLLVLIVLVGIVALGLWVLSMLFPHVKHVPLSSPHHPTPDSSDTSADHDDSRRSHDTQHHSKA